MELLPQAMLGWVQEGVASSSLMGVWDVTREIFT